MSNEEVVSPSGIPEGFVPDGFIKDGAPDFDAFRSDYDAAKSAADAARGIVPEDFIKDGSPDFAAFRARYDEMAASAKEMAERRAALPKEDEYKWQLPEGFQKLEGLPEDFDPAAMIAEDDPDLATLRSILTKHEMPQEAMSDLAALMATREMRALQEASVQYQAERAKLGPDAKARIETVKGQLKSKLPEPLAKAVADGLTTADALKGIEKLLGARGTTTTTTSTSGVDIASMTPRERIAHGLHQRQQVAR